MADDKIPPGRMTYDEWIKTKQYALVRTVSTFYHVYAVPLDKLQELNPDSKVDAEWLKDSIVFGEIEELGQQHLGEQIIDPAEIVSEDQVLKLFDEINGYLSGWSKEQKIQHIRKLLEIGKNEPK